MGAAEGERQGRNYRAAPKSAKSHRGLADAPSLRSALPWLLPEAPGLPINLTNQGNGLNERIGVMLPFEVPDSQIFEPLDKSWGPPTL